MNGNAGRMTNVKLSGPKKSLLWGDVTPANFGQPGVTDYRNPNVADAMRVLGLVERFGIQTVQAELRRNGNPPAQFVVEPSRVVAIVRMRPA